MSAEPTAPRGSWRDRHPALAGAFWVWVAAVGAGMVGTMAGFLGIKGVGLVAVAFLFLTALLLLTKREELILATAVVALFALFHKSLGTKHLDVSGGPISIYVSSFDVMVFILWFTWWVRGPREMAQQLRVAFRRPVMWAPIAAFAFILPSVLSAPVTGLAVAEIVRMMAATAVFVYFAARIQSKAQVWIVLGALGAAVSVEALIVAGQYASHSALGMSTFGTPTTLNNRAGGASAASGTFSGYDALRPFGTIVHPVFLGAFVAPCALMAYSLAANLRTTGRRLVCLAVAAVAATPIFFADARSAAFGLVAGFLVLTIAFIVTGRLTSKVLKRSILSIVVLLALLFPFVSGFVQRSFESRSGGQTTRTATCTRAVDAATTCSSHFSFEWRARMQLNHLGVKVWEQQPIVGAGLNNFEQVMDRYDTYGLIFADAPVHNLYLLQLAETGLLGLIGLFVLAVPLFLVAVRLARSKDRLFSAIGFGVTGMFIFFAVEEMLEFSLRQEQPRALFFMFSGIAVACSRLAGLDRPRPVLQARRMRPPAPTNGDRPVATRGDAPRRNGARAGVRRGAHHASRGVRRARGLAAVTWFAAVRHSRTAAERLELTRVQRLAAARRRRRRALSAALAGLMLAGGSVSLAGAGTTAPDPSIAGLKIVFSAFDRISHQRGIYTADGDGTNIRKISPDDGRDYSWPTWAYGGQQISFTARATGQVEPVFLMNPDGTHIRPITANPWRNAQPKVAADGRSMLFTSFWNEYQKVAIYRMDFATGAVTNLSAVASQSGAFDSDPALATDGRIVFIDARDPKNGTNRPGQVAMMNPDGSGHRLLTDNGLYNTDPQPSPDVRDVAIARYVGTGTPHDPASSNPFQTKLQDFVLVKHNVATGLEQQLTLGQPCFKRSDGNPCAPAEGPSYVPQWTPDGNAIGYMSVLSADRTCVCVVNRDGSSPRVVLESTQLAINWFSWIRPGAPAPGSITDPKPQGQMTPKRMILSGTNRAGQHFVLETTPDRFGDQALPIPQALAPETAKLSPDRSQVWFDGQTNFDPNSVVYGPAPPAGVGRTRHYTIGFLNQYFTDPSILRASAASRQVMSLQLSPRLRMKQVTTAGTEDYRDAIPDGEARGNALPAISPNGRYVIFTNISTVNNESFVLRYDRVTGEVLNLTNATAGAVAVADAQASWSPDSSKVVFASNELDGMQIWVMDADGYHAHKITDDKYLNLMPTWSPDGKYVVYASYRGQDVGSPGSDDLALAAANGKIDLRHWVLVRVDVATGQKKILVQSAQSPMFRPVYDPDGSKIYYIGITGPPLQSDVYVVDANGGVARPLQVTMETFETAVDIK